MVSVSFIDPFSESGRVLTIFIPDDDNLMGQRNTATIHKREKGPVCQNQETLETIIRCDLPSST